MAKHVNKQNNNTLKKFTSLIYNYCFTKRFIIYITCIIGFTYQIVTILLLYLTFLTAISVKLLDEMGIQEIPGISLCFSYILLVEKSKLESLFPNVVINDDVLYNNVPDYELRYNKMDLFWQNFVKKLRET